MDWLFRSKKVVMAEVILSDALVIALSEQINITLYPVSNFAIDLGFNFSAASAAEELAIRKQHPQGKYEHLLQRFVTTHGRDAKAAQDLVDIFKVKQKTLLVNFLEIAIEKQNALKQFGLAEGQSQTGRKSISGCETGITASTLSDIPLQESAAAAGAISTFQASDTVSDAQLTNLAARIPCDKYHDLSNELGIGYNKASHVLMKHGGDSERATQECLYMWKNKTGGGFTELNRIFNSVDLGGLWMDYVDIPLQDATAGADEVVLTSQASDTVSDAQLTYLAASIPHDTYHHLSHELGIGYNQASNIMEKHGRDSKRATQECLYMWKNKTGGGFTELNRIFNSVDLGGIWLEFVGIPQASLTDRNLDGRLRKRKKKTNRRTDSSDEDDRTRGDKQSKSHGYNDNSLDGPPRVLGFDEHHKDGGQTEINSKEAFMNGMAPWKRSRIMVIGPAGVGKTSLIRRLTGQEFNIHEKSTKGAEQNVVTKSAVNSWELVNDAHTAKDDLIQSIAMDSEIRSHSQRATGGEENRSDQEITDSNRSTPDENEKIANILQGITREEITKVKSSKVDITYSIWDFGGQEVYYITHPLFLSWRSLYILVIPLHLELNEEAPRKEDAENAPKPLKGSVVKTHRTILDLVHFWLMSVYTHAVPYSHPDSTYEPKVLIIGTFAGDKSMRISQEKVDSKVQELKVMIGSQPYEEQILFPICVIDNKSSTRSEVITIQDRIDTIITDLEYMEVPKPVKWRTFLTELERSDQSTLTVKEARKRLNTWGINDDKEVDDLLKFYHEIGHLIYHEGCDLTVLKPQFLNSIVSNIITVIDEKKMKGGLGKHWTYLKENGILSIALIQAVWKEHKGDDDQLNNIINMMIKFDLICEIPNRPNEKRQFFVPCRSSPNIDTWEEHETDENVEFTIDFHHFLPDGVLHRFYVRMAQWSMERNPSIEPTFHCREMVFSIDNGHGVVMTNAINEGHDIKVKIYAVAPFGAPSERTTNRISLNEDIIDYLHETLENLKDLWARRLEYRVGIWCPRCATFKRKGWIHIRDILKSKDKTARCNKGCTVYVTDRNIQEAFSKGPAKTSLGRTGASTAADKVSTSQARSAQKLKDAQLIIVSKEVPLTQYNYLSVLLGCSLNSAKKILAKHHQDYTEALLEVLNAWNQRTTCNHRDKLIEALIEVEVAGRITEIFPDYVHDHEPALPKSD